MPLPLASIRRQRLVATLVDRFPGLAGRLHDVITRHTPLVPVEILEASYVEILTELVRRHRPEDLGSYLEFGVYRGDSMLCMQRASERLGLTGMRLVGFDSFAGMPDTTDEADEATRSGGGLSYRPGALRSPYEETVKAMTRRGADWQRIRLVPGWYDETLRPETRTQAGIESASVILIDCVLHSSSLAALEFCEPLIRDEAVVVLDDWDAGVEVAAEGATGERRAFEEFIAARPDLEAEAIGSYEHAEDDPPSLAMIMRVRRVGQPS